MKTLEQVRAETMERNSKRGLPNIQGAYGDRLATIGNEYQTTPTD